MRSYLTYTADHPGPVVLVVLLLSLGAASQLGDLRIQVTPQALSVGDDADSALYQGVQATFGSDSSTLVVVRDADLFHPARLEAVRVTLDHLHALPEVAGSDSLFSVPHLRVVDDFVHTEAYLQQIPATRQDAERIRQAALADPLVRGNLLSADGTTMAIHLRPRHDARSGGDADERTAAAIEAAIAPLAAKVDEVFQIGGPFVRSAMRDAIQRDLTTLLPLSLLVLLLILALALRGSGAALLPLLTSGLSVLWVLGGMAALGIPVNLMTAIVPVLLVVVGSTEDIHLIAEYRDRIGRGYRRRRAVHRMARSLGLAVLLTFLTSYLGFLATATSPMQLLREFGLVASTGLAVNFLLTAALVPAYLRYFGRRRPAAAGHRLHRARERALGVIGCLWERCAGRTLALSLAAAALAASGATALRVNNNVLDYFDPGSPVAYRAAVMHDSLSGIETLSIVLKGPGEGAFLQRRYLDELTELQRYLQASPAFDFSASIADCFDVLNRGLNEAGASGLPDDEVLAELSNLLERDRVRPLVSEDYSQARILVRHDLMASDALAGAVDGLQAFIDGHIDGALQVHVTGESLLASRAADRIVGAQAGALALMLCAILGLVSWLFSSLRAGLVAVLVNAFPVTMLFGLMGYAGIPLDVGTSMIATIAVGICVDNTMHFMVRYEAELRHCRSEPEAVARTVRGELAPITVASVALAAGLGTLALSGFTPVASFGVLSGMVILFAYYANFVLTPILLTLVRLDTGAVMDREPANQPAR